LKKSEHLDCLSAAYPSTLWREIEVAIYFSRAT
jgi:hypothetical protein